MNIEELEKKIVSIETNLDQENFIYDLLLAYGQPKASITRLKKGDYNQVKQPGTVLWKKKLYFRSVTEGDLHALIDSVQNDSEITRHYPRFVIITDFKTLLAVDSKTGDTLDTPFQELHRHTDFFLPWAGMEKSQIQSESLADIKAAERLARLYDIIVQDNDIKDEADRHTLNIFLSRLLFCFFAEDTGIFENDQFTNAVASHTTEDASDLQTYLQKLFGVLNLSERTDTPEYLKAFPYVNGGLFAEESPVPSFSHKARKIIIECGSLDWKAINPDIFGSMIQAVVHGDQRGSLGMHYTSVVNIMKVIAPLFLNALQAQLEKAEDNENKLTKLLDRLYHLKLFDPACGSGNFLIIAYKELCKLEIEAFKQLQRISNAWNLAKSGIRLTQFCGIEIDDFASQTARLSLWLAEHQMNLAFREVFGDAKPTLPLQEGGQIVCGNALRLDWLEVCPPMNKPDEEVETYLIGNPPYLGSTWQNKEQKADLAIVFSPLTKKFKNLDYVAAWYLKGAQYCASQKAECAFVATNSICQGQQVALLWPLIFDQGIEISFAHQSFKWKNLATQNAGVTCIIAGLRRQSNKTKYLFAGNSSRQVSHIGPYLIEMPNIIVQKATSPLNGLPGMIRGNMPTDGGNLILSPQDKNQLLEQYPQAAPLVRRLYGSQELIKGIERYSLWIRDEDLPLAQSIEPIAVRIKKVRKMRMASRDSGANKMASRSHQFREMNEAKEHAIIIPCISSENRSYLPVDILTDGSIVQNKAFAIYDGPVWVMAVIASRLHLQWIAAVCVRLRSDFSYSNTLGYNTFPFPDITEAQKTSLEDHVFKVLDEREQHPEKTMAQLYDPDKMPDGLRQAHHDMDMAVEQCYRKQPFKSDEKRLEYLFKLYEEMIENEER